MMPSRRYVRAEPHPAELDATQMRDGSWMVWSHEVWHGERSGVARARMSSAQLDAYVAGWSEVVPSVRVYESDGSDGYSPGTWGVTVTLGDSCSGSGGHPSRERAEQCGRKLARAAQENWA